MFDPDPILAKAKRDALCSISETEFMQWRHQPITAGYIQYLFDLIDLYREAVADMAEQGTFTTDDPHPDRNPQVMRGQILMLRQLGGVTIEQIKQFYAPPAADGEEAEQEKAIAYDE